MPLAGVSRGRIDGEVVKHRAQCLARPIAEHFARDHEYLAAVEVIEKRRELEPVPAWPEVTVVEQGHLRAASLPAWLTLDACTSTACGRWGRAPRRRDVPAERPVPSARGRRGGRGPTYSPESTPRLQRPGRPVEERLIPATAAGPVVLGYEEVRPAEHPAAAHEDVRMLIEVVTKTHGPRLHRPDHHKGRQGHRVVTTIDVLQTPPESAPGTHSRPGQTRDAKEYSPAPGAHPQPREPAAPPRAQPDGYGTPGQPGRSVSAHPGEDAVDDQVHKTAVDRLT